MHRGGLVGRVRAWAVGKQVDAGKEWGSNENCQVHSFPELDLQRTAGFGHSSGVFAWSNRWKHWYDVWECKKGKLASWGGNFILM